MLKILVLDDDNNIRKMIKRRLEKLNYQVDTFGHHLEAQDALLRDKKYNLLLLDQKMPELDGAAVFDLFKEKGINVPTIMITAFSSVQLAVSFLNKGGADFIEKPLDFDVLELKIKRALREKELEEKNKIAETKIKESLKEKETLLREIHHRIKNSLFIVSSLLNMQANQFEAPQVRQAFKITRARIQSMAIVHEELYKSHDLSHLNLGRYIEKLSRHLSKIYMKPESPLNLESHLEDIYLDTDRSVYCGLIATELLTNGLKYASSCNNNKTIMITATLQKIEGKNIRFTVADNGDGLDDDFDIETSESLGLKLVKMLSEQLKGSLEIESKKGQGAVFSIMFPLEE